MPGGQFIMVVDSAQAAHTMLLRCHGRELAGGHAASVFTARASNGPFRFLYRLSAVDTAPPASADICMPSPDFCSRR